MDSKYNISKARDVGPTRHGRREELVSKITPHRSLPTPLLSTVSCTIIIIVQYLENTQMVSQTHEEGENRISITSLRHSCVTLPVYQ